MQKPEYKLFEKEKYRLYAVSYSELGTQRFIKKHGSRFKGIKVTRSPNNPEELVVWTKL